MAQEEEKKDVKIIANFEDEGEETKVELEGELITASKESNL